MTRQWVKKKKKLCWRSLGTESGHPSSLYGNLYHDFTNNKNYEITTSRGALQTSLFNHS